MADDFSFNEGHPEHFQGCDVLQESCPHLDIKMAFLWFLWALIQRQ